MAGPGIGKGWGTSTSSGASFSSGSTGVTASGSSSVYYHTYELVGRNGRRITLPHPNSWTAKDSRSVLDLLMIDGIVERHIERDVYFNTITGKGVTSQLVVEEPDWAVMYLIGFTTQIPDRFLYPPPGAQQQMVPEKLDVKKNPALYEFNEEVGF